MPILAIIGALLFGVATAWAQAAPPTHIPYAPHSDDGEPVTGQTEVIDHLRSLIDKGLFSEAEQNLRSFLAAHENSGRAHFLLGYVLFRQIQAHASREGQIDTKLEEANAKAALAEYTLGAKYDRPGAFELKIVALNYVLLGDYADADKWLTRSLELNPKDSESWYYLGRAKYNENLFEGAVNAFNQCLIVKPGDVKAEDNLGLAYAGENHYEDATAAYQKAIEWQSKSLIQDSGPFIDFGNLLLERNQAAEAIPYLSQAVSISPQQSRGHAALGKAYSRTGDLANARTELEKAVELAPNNASLHYVLGQVYRKLGLTDKAKAELDRTAELNGSHSAPINDLPVDGSTK